MARWFLCVLLAFASCGDALCAERLIMKPGAKVAKVSFNAPSEASGSGEVRRAVRDGRMHEWRLEGISPVREECVLDASKRFGVPVSIILAIMDVEGGEIGGREGNRNGTWDLGPMQVNTCHMEELAPFGFSKREIESNGCLNVQIGTWLLKRQLEATGGKLLEAVGRYHSSNEPYKSRYQRKAIAAYRNIKKDPDAHVDRILDKANSPLKRGK